MTEEKLDLFKQHKAEYAKPKKPAVVATKKARYLAVAGRGAPGGDEFQARVGALYGMAYTLKFKSKMEDGKDYKVAPLEARWRDASEWELLIRTPEFITKKQLCAARDALHEKGKGDGADAVELKDLNEGLCVQMLHVGPYDQEGETIETMMEFAAAEGLEPDGLHHPRRVPPDRLRTILRQPVRKR